MTTTSKTSNSSQSYFPNCTSTWAIMMKAWHTPLRPASILTSLPTTTSLTFSSTSVSKNTSRTAKKRINFLKKMPSTETLSASVSITTLTRTSTDFLWVSPSKLKISIFLQESMQSWNSMKWLNSSYLTCLVSTSVSEAPFWTLLSREFLKISARHPSTLTSFKFSKSREITKQSQRSFTTVPEEVNFKLHTLWLWKSVKSTVSIKKFLPTFPSRLNLLLNVKF